MKEIRLNLFFSLFNCFQKWADNCVLTVSKKTYEKFFSKKWDVKKVFSPLLFIYSSLKLLDLFINTVHPILQARSPPPLFSMVIQTQLKDINIMQAHWCYFLLQKKERRKGLKSPHVLEDKKKQTQDTDISMKSIYPKPLQGSTKASCSSKLHKPEL